MNPNVSVFVVFVILASALAKPNREEWQATKQKCIEETGVDPERVKGPPHGDENEPMDDKEKCFHACIMKQFNKFNEDGTVNVEAKISRIPEDMPERERVVAALTECGAKKGDNDCETAYEFHTCMRDQKLPHMGHHHHH